MKQRKYIEGSSFGSGLRWAQCTVVLVSMCCTVSAQLLPETIVQYAILEQQANHMISDPARSRLIISIPSTDQAQGNSLGYIDPVMAELTDAVFMGSGPSAMALTDDSEFLYVGMNGAGSVKRLNLSTGLVDQTFSMGVGWTMEPLQAGVISCQPGSSNRLAVARQFLGSSVAAPPGLFEDGVELPQVLPAYESDAVRFKPEAPDRLVGIYNESVQSRMYTFGVSDEGAEFLNLRVGLFQGDGREFIVDGNEAFVDDGSVIDISADVPLPVGLCNIPEGTTSSRVCLDTHQDLICIAFRKACCGDTLHIWRFDRQTLLAQDRILIPGVITPGVVKVTDMVCWGDSSRYAVNMSNGRILIINGEDLPTGSPGMMHTTSTRIRHNGEYVWYNCSERVTIEIMDEIGRLQRVNAVGNRVGVGDLAQGIYIARVSTEEGEPLDASKFLVVR